MRKRLLRQTHDVQVETLKKQQSCHRLIIVESDAAQTAIVWLLSPMPLKQPLSDYWVQCRSNSHCLIIVESNATQTAIVWLLSPMPLKQPSSDYWVRCAAQTAIVWLLSPMPLKQPSSDYWVQCRSNSHRLIIESNAAQTAIVFFLLVRITWKRHPTPELVTPPLLPPPPPPHTHTHHFVMQPWPYQCPFPRSFPSSYSLDLISVRSHVPSLHHTALTLSVPVPTFPQFVIQPWPYQCPFPRSLNSSCSLDLISVRSNVPSLCHTALTPLLYVPSFRHTALTLPVPVPTRSHFVRHLSLKAHKEMRVGDTPRTPLPPPSSSPFPPPPTRFTSVLKGPAARRCGQAVHVHSHVPSLRRPSA